MTANLYDAPQASPGEVCETLAGGRGGWKLERILSFGCASPDGFWYDQAQDEWVTLLRGTAVLEFDGAPPLPLKAGDHVVIPARQRHRVSAVSPDAVWLALHAEVLEV
jgi:cupin 2 domain-containing protein